MASMLIDIDDLGPIGIIREAFKIFRTYAKVFLLIQLTFLLDVVTLAAVGQYFLAQHYSSAPRGPTDGLHSTNAAALDDPSPDIDVVRVILVASVFVFVYNFALSLSLSATLYSVALHYAGQAVSFVDVIRASVPRLWMRLALTSSYTLLIANVIMLVQSVCLRLLPHSHRSWVWMVVFSTVESLSSLVLYVGISAIISVAESVSVFEEDYGWAALSKGLKLLKGKAKVAIFLQILLFLPAIIQGVFKFGFLYETGQADFGEWNYLTRTLTGAASIVWTSFTLQLLTLCYGVQYASFNAYHKSVSITDSVKPEKVGYESVGNGASEPLLGGQQTDSTV